MKTRRHNFSDILALSIPTRSSTFSSSLSDSLASCVKFGSATVSFKHFPFQYFSQNDPLAPSEEVAYSQLFLYIVGLRTERCPQQQPSEKMVARSTSQAEIASIDVWNGHRGCKMVTKIQTWQWRWIPFICHAIQKKIPDLQWTSRSTYSHKLIHIFWKETCFNYSSLTWKYTISINLTSSKSIKSLTIHIVQSKHF